MKSVGETIVQLNYNREEGDTEEVRTVVWVEWACKRIRSPFFTMPGVQGVCPCVCQHNAVSFGRLIFYCSPQNHVSLIYYWKVTAQKATRVSHERLLLMPAAGVEGIRSSIQLQKLISQNSVSSCMASLRQGLATQQWSKHSSCWKHLMVCGPICSRQHEDFGALMSNFYLTIPRQDIEPSWRPLSTCQSMIN